jgi:uncharacterized coiled-coil DUF342 family protein
METAKDKIIERTLEIWQPRTSRKLTREDGRQMVENISGFFDTLSDWEAKENKPEVKDFNEILSDAGQTENTSESIHDRIMPGEEAANSH